MTEYVYLQSTYPFWFAIGDFGNIFKAFIGTNYLSLAYGFKQSGLAFGLAGLVVIALLTGFCCQLIVTCKHIVIDNLCEQQVQATNKEHVSLSEGGAKAGHARKLGGAAPDTSMLRLHLQNNLDYADLGRLTFGLWGAFIVNTCLLVTQIGFCMGYFIFIGNTLHSLIIPPGVSHNNDTLNVTNPHWNDHPDPDPTLLSKSPSLTLLVLVPLPILVAFTMFRDVRQMAPVSIMANFVILIGLFACLVYVMIDFTISPTVVWMQWKTFPVFFGQMMSAYEAIGLIIPIESSMHGGARRFPQCLCGAMSLFTCLLAALSVCGYLRYGDDTHQIIAQNIVNDRVAGILINLTLVFGVLCTYPLQIFPVVEIFEGILFNHGRPFGPSLEEDEKPLLISDVEDAKKSFLPHDESHFHLSVARYVPKSVASWKRNLFRAFITVVIASFAVLLRNVFAYVGALVGAMGGCPLAFILPCLFHLRLRRHLLSKWSITYHVVIIVVGTAASVISVVVVLIEITERV